MQKPLTAILNLIGILQQTQRFLELLESMHKDAEIMVLCKL